MRWFNKPYEAPSEYEAPKDDKVFEEYVFNRHKPDKPESFEDKVRQEQERLESERKNKRG